MWNCFENLKFVKFTGTSFLQARKMFDGEYISLDVLNAMETVRVPKPIKVVSEIMYMSVLKQTLL